MTNATEGDIDECYGRGFCTAENETAPTSKWYCRCRNHFANETGKGKNTVQTNCSVCMNKYTVTDDG